MSAEIRFSPREVEVIYAIARARGKNKTLAELAEDMGLRPGTIKDYATSARLKLGVKYTRELPYAYREVTGINPFPE